MKRPKQLLQIVLILIYFSSCANVGMPLGGPVDEDPPELLRAIPSNESVNFRANTISLQFDENIQLGSRQKILISPPLDVVPGYNVRGRNLDINLQNAELRPNTTYVINFSDVLRDLNEGNVLHDFKYVFSTGDFIDTLTIEGRITDLQSGQPQAGIMVLAYNEGNDTSIIKDRPMYMTTTRTDGSFILDFLTEGNFWLYALDDRNSNLRFERNERAGFHPFSVNSMDTLDTLGIHIEIFRSYPDSLRILAAITEEPGFYRLIFNRPVNEVSISFQGQEEGREKRPWEFQRLHPGRDTLSIWTTLSLPDTFKLDVNVDGMEREVSFIKGRLKPRTLNVQSNFVFGKLPPPHQIVLKFPVPILAFSEDSLMLYTEEEQILKNSSLANDLLSLLVEAELVEEQEYTFSFPRGTFRSILGTENDSFSVNFTLSPASEYGLIHGMVEYEFENQLIIQLVERDTLVRRQMVLNSEDNLFQFNNLVPGQYKIRVIDDANNNSIWDSGNIYRRRLPERLYIFPETLTVRPNWEMRELVVEPEF